MNPGWAFLLGGLVAMLVVAGCHNPSQHGAPGVSVIVEGNDGFPVVAAGRWKADRHGWEFVFEPDGRIASAVISLGRVRIVPGLTTTVPTRSGGEGIFTPGLWTVRYVPDTRLLTVKITMDRVRVEMGGNIVEGASTDVFTGSIDTVEGLWQVQWTTFTQYTGRTSDGASLDLSTDATYGETTLLTFKKTLDP